MPEDNFPPLEASETEVHRSDMLFTVKLLSSWQSNSNIIETLRINGRLISYIVFSIDSFIPTTSVDVLKYSW